MAARNEVDTQNKLKNFFRDTAGFNNDQQNYLTGNLRHQMGYTELSKFGRLNEETGIDSFLQRFEKPLPEIIRGTGGAADNVRIQEVRLNPTVQQDLRDVHRMHHFYVQAGHTQANLPKEFFSPRRVSQFN